jgi:hypothetical protein
MVGVLFAVGIFVGMSRNHVDKVEAIEIAKVEIGDRAYPLVDGKTLEKDVMSNRELLLRLNHGFDYLIGLRDDPPEPLSYGDREPILETVAAHCSLSPENGICVRHHVVG